MPIWQEKKKAENGGTNGYGVYTIPAETNLKQYYIKGEYTDEHFGTGKVIAPVEGTSGKARFYVMALEDINPGTYYLWYAGASGKLDKTVSNGDNDFGQGRENTEYVNNKWNDPSLPWGEPAHSTVDHMWEVIQEEIEDGWFVPSKSEWSAFGKAFDITSSNYSSTYGLRNDYWSSSQRNAYTVYYSKFSKGYIDWNSLSFVSHVRLATTF